jgi:hypothetical protein
MYGDFECLCELDRIKDVRMTTFEHDEKRHIAGLFKTHQPP